MSRPWQPEAHHIGEIRAPSPVKGVAAAAASGSTDASHVSAETVAVNATGLKFAQSVSLSDASKQRRETVNMYTRDAPGIGHCTLAAVASTAQELNAPPMKFNAVVADGSVTREAVEAFVEDDVACSALSGLTLIRSVRSTVAMSALLEAMVRDEAAFSMYIKREEAIAQAREERERAAATADEEEMPDEAEADAEDLGPRPPKPTKLKLSTLALVQEAASFAESATAAADVAKLVEQSPCLEVLRLVGCGVSGAACTQLGSAVLASRSLTTLDISGNGFGRDEEPPTDALAQMLQQSKFLLDVNLADNDMSAAMTKQLAEALASSNTRVPTPEQDPLPEFEPWIDELPDADEPPQQPVGYPADENAAAADDAAVAADDEAPAAADATDAAPPAEEKEEGDEDEEDEEAAPEAAQAPAEEDEDLDEEELERIAEEKAEAARAAREEAEAAWREREEQYIWGPQRAHMENDEHVARRGIMQEHINDTAEIKKAQFDDRGVARGHQQEREAKDRVRRSGWSHLTALSLAGNPIASEGAIALADALRSELPLANTGDEEVADGDGAADDEAPAGANDGDAEEHEEDAEGRGDEDRAEEAAEDAPAPAAAEPATAADPPPRPTTKPGFATLRHLDVSRASIGSKGMVALAGVIANNCPALTSLNLTRNKFALKHVHVPDPNGAEKTDDADGEGDDAPPMKRIPVTDWVSAGVEALAAMVQQNRSLKSLRLGHNHLYPMPATKLFGSLSSNTCLTELLLEGNPIGHAGNVEAFQLLLRSLGTMPQLARLNLSNTLCASAMAAVSADELAGLFRVEMLDISFNEIGKSPRTMLNLAAAAKQCSAPNIKELVLDGNAFDSDAHRETHSCICDVVMALVRRLEGLSIAAVPKLGDAVARDLVKLLVSAPALRALSLRGSRVDVVDAATKLVANAGYLRVLDLGDTRTSEDGAQSLSGAVAKSSTLATFALWSRDRNVAPVIMAAFAQSPARTVIEVDAGCRAPTGSEPTDDSDLAFDVEDVEVGLLRNRIRGFKRQP